MTELCFLSVFKNRIHGKNFILTYLSSGTTKLTKKIIRLPNYIMTQIVRY